MQADHVDSNQMKIRLKFFELFILCFTLFKGVFAVGGILNVFKGTGSLQSAIRSRDSALVGDILKWKKCHLLLSNENSLLKQLYFNFHPDFVNNIITNYCKTKEFFDEAINSALLHDDDFMLDSLLALLGEIMDHQNFYFHEQIFESCVNSHNYKCIETMVDWKIPLKSLNKNIIHFAAVKDDTLLLRYAPLNKRLMNQRDSMGNYPYHFVSSKEMAVALNDRWEVEVQLQEPKWAEVQTIHQMARNYDIPDKTLKFRVAHTMKVLKKDLAKKPFKLTISRDNALVETYAAVSASPSRWYKPDLNVVINFKNEHGIDAGGPRIEWLNILIGLIFNNKNTTGNVEDFSAPLFKIIDQKSMMYAPTNLYDDSVYKFVGSIIALAFRDQISLKIKLIPAISKQLTSKHWIYSEEDFAQQHPQTYQSLMNLHALSEEFLEASGLEFESDPTKMVTKDNLNDYIQDIGRHRLLLDHQPAVQALVSGFKAISKNAQIPSLFNHHEIITILKGGEEDLTQDEFLQNCLYDIPESMTEKNAKSAKSKFEKMIRSMTPQELMKLFKFITARESLAFDRLDGLEQKIVIKFDFLSENSYPVSATCFSHLKLPKNLKSPEELKEKIMFSIAHSNTFTTQ